MHLLVFDVDGTLVDSNRYDGDCFVRAVTTVFGIPAIDTDWSSYKHATESGILEEAIQRSYGRGPNRKEISLVQERYLSELEQAYAKDPDLGQAIQGAIGFLEEMTKSPEIAVSIATGGWERIVRKKLVRSGFFIDNIPLATADDSISRIEIMKASLCRSQKAYGLPAFQSIAYVGDASWDQKASIELGWNFIAVGAQILHSATSRPKHWVKDFRNFKELARILSQIGIACLREYEEEPCIG